MYQRHWQTGKPERYSWTTINSWQPPLLVEVNQVGPDIKGTRRRNLHFAVTRSNRQIRRKTMMQWTWIGWQLRYNVSALKNRRTLWRRASVLAVESLDISLQI